MCPGSTIITDASEAVFSNTSLLALPLQTLIPSLLSVAITSFRLPNRIRL